MALDLEHCERAHAPLWTAINRLPLWGRMLIFVIGPICLGLGGWALASCASLGERVRGVEVKECSDCDMLREVRDDVKKLLAKEK